MNDKKERVYSEEDLCEYTILQKIDELEKQLKNIKNEFNGLYETKEAANAIHVKLRQSDAKINNRIDGLYNITPTDLIASANKLSLGVGNAPLGNGVNLDGFTYDEGTKTLKAGGGGELTGEALMNVTKDSTTITRTLDTDGKVKLDAQTLKSITKDISVNLKPKEYNIGDMITGTDINVGHGSPVSVILPTAQYINGVNFIATYYATYSNEVRISFICVKGGTLTQQKQINATAKCWYI